MKILVTGSLGCIGHTLVDELERRGHEVWGCDLAHAPRERYLRTDVREHRQLERTLEKVRPELVYNLAAEYGRWNGEEHYENLWATNVVGCKHMLRLQERMRFRLVQFSSAEVYGDHDGVMSEDVMDRVPLKQMNDYAMSKWVNEMQVLNSAAMFGTESVRVRPVNVYGPGEPYTPYRGVVPNFVYKALKGEPFTVYRGHKRIFDYVEDTCRTFANIADNFVPGEVYNVGGPKEWEIDIARLAEVVIHATGCDPSLARYKEAEPFTTKVKTIDTTKARRDLKHDPKVPIEVGIPRTVEWMRAHYGFK